VVLPRRNEWDLEGIPPEVRRDLEFVRVDTAEQVLEQTLLPAPERVS
jgi:ATP-dependent Lon protease